MAKNSVSWLQKRFLERVCSEGRNLPRLRPRRRAALSGYRLAVRRARRTSLRRSNPHARHADVSLPRVHKHRGSHGSLCVLLFRGEESNLRGQVPNLMLCPLSYLGVGRFSSWTSGGPWPPSVLILFILVPGWKHYVSHNDVCFLLIISSLLTHSVFSGGPWFLLCVCSIVSLLVGKLVPSSFSSLSLCFLFDLFLLFFPLLFARRARIAHHNLFSLCKPCNVSTCLRVLTT